jgi:hypothetical protein
MAEEDVESFDVLGSGAGGPLSPPTPWIQYAGYIQYPGGVVVGNPIGGNKGNGTVNVQSYYLNGSIVNLASYLLLAGGTMTGELVLASDPVNPFDAATKRYIDNLVAAINATFPNYLPLAGGTITGNLTINGTTLLSGSPTTALQAATKGYVDSQVGGITIPDAPSDGTTYGRNNAAWSGTFDAGTF